MTCDRGVASSEGGRPGNISLKVLKLSIQVNVEIKLKLLNSMQQVSPQSASPITISSGFSAKYLSLEMAGPGPGTCRKMRS